MSINKPDTDESDEASQVYSGYVKQRAPEVNIEGVMMLLAKEGLVEGSTKTSNNQETEVNLELVHRVYQRYRVNRSENSGSNIDSVMAAIAESPPIADSEQNTLESEVVKPIASSDGGRQKMPLFHRIFALPGQLLTKTVGIIRSISTFPKVAVPAVALALTAVALIPFMMNTQTGGSNGIQVATFSPSSSLLGTEMDLSSALDVQPGITMGLSGSSTAQLRSFQLGRSLYSVRLLSKAERVPPAIAKAVAAKLSLAGSGFKEIDSNAAVSQLVDFLSAHSFDPNTLEIQVTAVRQLGASVEKDSGPWLAFGEAVEAMAIATRLARMGELVTFKETFDQFVKMDFPNTLELLPTRSSELLLEIYTLQKQEVSTQKSVDNVRKLIQQLVLSLG